MILEAYLPFTHSHLGFLQVWLPGVNYFANGGGDSLGKGWDFLDGGTAESLCCQRAFATHKIRRNKDPDAVYNVAQYSALLSLSTATRRNGMTDGG